MTKEFESRLNDLVDMAPDDIKFKWLEKFFDRIVLGVEDLSDSGLSPEKVQSIRAEAQRAVDWKKAGGTFKGYVDHVVEQGRRRKKGAVSSGGGNQSPTSA